MYGAPISNTLSFSKVLSGLSKTLTVANQVLPLYKQAKPLISNLGSVRTILSSLTQSTTNSNSSKTTSKKTSIQINENIKKEENIPNLPTFFK